ncbi:MAG: hypothetical protein HYX48_03710 [Chlamydiales bacterium]|nr:hypothetical protein [Chlamydiales bacterium]
MAATVASRPHPMQDVEGVLPHILSFCTGDKSLSLVSHAFRASNPYAMVAEGRRILMMGADYEAQMVLQSRRFMNAGESLEQALERLRSENASHVLIMHHLFSMEEREVVSRILVGFPTEELPTDTRTLVFFGELDEAFRVLYAPRVSADDRPERMAQKEALKQVFAKFNYRESLRQRAEQVFRGRLNLDVEAPHTQSAACLRELHQNQRDRISVHGRLFADFVTSTRAHQNSFSAERFVAQEGQCRALESEEDLALVNLWNRLRETYSAHFPAEVERRAPEIREWLNDPANEAALGQVKILWLVDYALLPPEIGKFRNLTHLSFNPRYGSGIHLRALPDEITNLTKLAHLTIRGPDFETVPEVLSRVRATVEIRDNQRRAILPESVALQHRTGMWAHVDELLWAMSGRERAGSNLEFSLFMGMRREELSEIPFFLWFRETFSVPYLYQLNPLQDRSTAAIATYIQGLDLPGPVSALLEALGYMLVMYAQFAYNALICIPTFLLNLLLDYTVQPLVTYCRSLLGYSPMVRL